MTKQIQNPKSKIQNWISAAVVALAATPALAQPEPSPPEMREDAQLTAVTFLNADRGWAVGDRGVIWHTVDGGRSWKQQDSGVTCRLETVQFLDSDNGWAAGGWTQPYTHETHGVVLRTRDGGIYSCKPAGVPGDPDHPVSDDLLEAKFRDCVSFSATPIPSENIDRAIALIRNLDELSDVTEIVRLLVPARSTQR